MGNSGWSLKSPRIVFLFTLSVSVSILFYWLIKDFILAVVMAAVMASLVHPMYLAIVKLLRGRPAIASAITVMSSLLLVIVPLLIFTTILVNQALELSDTAEDWVNTQVKSGELEDELKENPTLQKLLPYQDKLLEKAGQLAADAGAVVAENLTSIAKGTATFFLMLFIMLYAMFFFLMRGPRLLLNIFEHTPLREADKNQLLNTFTSVARATLKGTLVIAFIQGGLGGIAFWAAGIQGAVFWAAIMMVASVIPGVGTLIVWVPAVIYLFLNGKVLAAIGVGLWCAAIVGTADNILRPMLIGKDTEMPDLVVLLTTLGGLVLFGVAGLVIGPIIGALFLTVWQLWGSAMAEGEGNTAPNEINN